MGVFLCGTVVMHGIEVRGDAPHTHWDNATEPIEVLYILYVQPCRFDVRIK